VFQDVTPCSLEEHVVLSCDGRGWRRQAVPCSLQPPSSLYFVTSQNYAVVTFDILLLNEVVWRKEFPNIFEVSCSLPSLILIVKTSVCSLQLLQPEIVQIIQET
jgi:hypothetical protein